MFVSSINLIYFFGIATKIQSIHARDLLLESRLRATNSSLLRFYDEENRFTPTFMYHCIKLKCQISQVFVVNRVTNDLLKIMMTPQQRKEDGEALNSHEKETGET